VTVVSALFGLAAFVAPSAYADTASPHVPAGWTLVKGGGITAQAGNALQSVANGRYVSAELSWGGDRNGLLRARATAIGPWERYNLR
jgi:hypothetical protein